MNSDYWSPMVPELICLDFHESFAFYTEALGFAVRFQRDDPDFAYLEYEQAQIMLEAFQGEARITGDIERPLGRGVNLQMEVSDLAPILERLKERNYGLFKEPKESWYQTGDTQSGQREFLVQDPDGYLLRFCQFLGKK